jgi:hypothetical protein
MFSRFRFFKFLPLVLFLFLLVSAAQAATFVVDRADDVAGANACTAAANDCSLRGAISSANANGAGSDTINFNVGGGNAQTINILQALPLIQTSLIIDGSTQPLWSVVPLVEINGLNAGAGTHGFYIAGGGNPVSVVIKSLIINRFGGSGIFFNATGESSLTVLGCYIGTSATAQTGKVGVVLAMPFNEAIQAGARHLVTVRFNVSQNAPGGQTPLTFGDLPVVRAVSDVNANTLASTFQDGAVNILGPTAASVSVGGRVLNGEGRGVSGARVFVTDQNGAMRVALTNQFGYYRFAAIVAGAGDIVDAEHKNYRFTSQFITVLEETNALNFIAESP